MWSARDLHGMRCRRRGITAPHAEPPRPLPQRANTLTRGYWSFPLLRRSWSWCSGTVTASTHRWTSWRSWWGGSGCMLWCCRRASCATEMRLQGSWVSPQWGRIEGGGGHGSYPRWGPVHTSGMMSRTVKKTLSTSKIEILAKGLQVVRAIGGVGLTQKSLIHMTFLILMTSKFMSVSVK